MMKELAPLPVMVVAEVNETADVPVLVSVIICTAEVEPTAVAGNVRLAVDSDRLVAEDPPVPLSATVLGEPVAVSV